MKYKKWLAVSVLCAVAVTGVLLEDAESSRQRRTRRRQK